GGASLGLRAQLSAIKAVYQLCKSREAHAALLQHGATVPLIEANSALLQHGATVPLIEVADVGSGEPLR
ncbi:hypothetical protein T484DRAFT_1805376, partial [Baffinella frigidus]